MRSAQHRPNPIPTCLPTCLQTLPRAAFSSSSFFSILLCAATASCDSLLLLLAAAASAFAPFAVVGHSNEATHFPRHPARDDFFFYQFFLCLERLLAHARAPIFAASQPRIRCFLSVRAVAATRSLPSPASLLRPGPLRRLLSLVAFETGFALRKTKPRHLGSRLVARALRPPASTSPRQDPEQTLGIPFHRNLPPPRAMDSPLQSPRHRGSRAFKTPEPSCPSDQGPSSRPLRFRVKKRSSSQRTAPTQQFLASVAAADIPIPSIEEPLALDDMLQPLDAPMITPHSCFDTFPFGEQPTRGRTLASPRTPISRAVPSLSPKRFPDWSLDASFGSPESSPECESSRPSTAWSSHTSATLLSQPSSASKDPSQCASPDGIQLDRFPPLLSPDSADKTIKAPARHATLRKAPWTRAMSKHLWSTYMMYLQDPKVTPFRIGKSAIPPSGVCLRVAREAKRSWKGSRPLPKPRTRSGSTTPTPDATAPYVEWPHTCAATRAHLRDLCKVNSGTAARNVRFLADSPTPFGRTAARHWSRRSVPARSPEVFSASDMALSLTVSTSESMQPRGPLAQLAGPPPPPESALSEGFTPVPMSAPVVSDPGFVARDQSDTTNQQRVRLGSPFVVAKSYGPSSTNTTLADSLGLTAEPRRQSRTVGTRRSLGSPVRLSGSSSSSINTQKRRSRQPDQEPRKSKRPSLGSDFWTDPSTSEAQASQLAPFAEFCSTSSNLRDTLFVPRTNLQELFEASSSHSSASHPLLMPPVARLGSPFPAAAGGKSASFSFPIRRPHTPSGPALAATRRPFATIHPPADAAVTSSAKPSLNDRLAYLDERLKDFRRQETPPRRSHSPF